MRLKSLRISGFKSFADQAELGFEGGVSGIVGPNGCGKSNIADALRWVLGGQNPKVLRADRMEDVIFAGSSSRKAAGMAEVSVLFDNSDGTFPLEFPEISISRRLYRSGDSEYLLNGSRCRLMDITDMLADCGLGSSGYWILESDMVRSILSGRTEDRRFLFDEAAGITRYKIQRHRARLKLEAASADLDRLEDIVGEVRRNVESLRRQAGLLARWEKAAARLDALETAAARRIADGLREGLLSLEKRHAECRRAAEDAEARVLSSHSALSVARTALEAAQADHDRRQTEASALEKALSDLKAEAAVETERAASAGRRAEEARTRAGILQEQAGEAGREAGEISGRISEAASAVETARASVERARVDLEGCAALHASALEARDRALAEADRARAALDEARKASSARAAARERAAGELALLSGEKLALESQLDEWAAAIESAEAASSEARARVEALSSEEAVLARSLDGCSAEAARAAAALESAVRERESAAALVSRASAELEALSAEGPAALMSVPEGLEAAVSAFLDGFGSARPEEGIDGLPDGRYLLPAPPSDLAAPGGTRRLSELVGTDSPAVRSLLSHGVLAAGRAEALEAARSARTYAVTADGDLFRPGGLARLGPNDGREGLLEKRARMTVLEAALDEVRSRVGTLGAAASEAAAALEAAREGHGRCSAELGQAVRLAASLEAGRHSLSARIDSGRSRLASLTERIPALEAAAAPDGASDPLDGLEVAEAAASSSARASERGLLEAVERLSRAREEAEAAAHALATAGTLAASLEERRRLLLAAAGDAAAEAAAASAAAEEEEESARIHAVRAGTAREAGRARAAELEGVLEELRRVAERRSDAAGSVHAAEDALAAARSAMESAREEAGRIAAEAAVARERLAQAESRMVPGGPDGEGAGLSDEELGAAILRAREDRERLGPVNMLARAEYEEAAGRLGFLEAQEEDLEKARKSIVQAIDEINATAAERFEETFEKVSENFQVIFSRFFEGGEARLVPLPGEDPLEGGIGIMARPHGKTLENLSALSGGERAMVAVALLFSLYLVRPAPFCVLDELDAPLDDANVERFLGLLESFSKDTQFLVVTHNRRTMEAATRLYGVTMAGDGISRLASVSLEEAADLG